MDIPATPATPFASAPFLWGIIGSCSGRCRTRHGWTGRARRGVRAAMRQWNERKKTLDEETLESSQVDLNSLLLSIPTKRRPCCATPWERVYCVDPLKKIPVGRGKIQLYNTVTLGGRRRQSKGGAGNGWLKGWRSKIDFVVCLCSWGITFAGM